MWELPFERQAGLLALEQQASALPFKQQEKLWAPEQRVCALPLVRLLPFEK